MKVIDFESIRELHISPEQCVQWAKVMIIKKYDALLPKKISIKFGNGCFFNTMPSFIPGFNSFGVKVVSRYPPPPPVIVCISWAS
jgi:hypothetical protein